MINSNIAVSIIVAVYNRASLLPRCIDSLVFQTLENIEIIMVDDYSTDNSWEVMEEWYRRFPEKIRLLKSSEKGAVHATNTGFKAAKGQYLTIVDSDDYVDYKMFERLYTCAKEADYPEVIHSPITSVSGTRRWNRGEMTIHETIEDYLKLDAFFLAGKLWRADLFQRFGYLPNLKIGYDTAWSYPTMSYIETITYYGRSGYFYELSPDSISMNYTDPDIVEDIMRGSQKIIENTNPIYKQLGYIFALRRVESLSRSRPQYQDITNAYLMKNMHLLDDIEDIPSVLAKKVEELKNGLFQIPRIIYINGFGKADYTEEVEKCKNVFFKSAEVVVLKEGNCNFRSVPKLIRQAYEQGKYDFVGKYFAIKHCFDKGGIYIDKDIVIDSSFELLRNDPCFFGFESDFTFTDKIFGACPGNACFEKLLQTYEVADMYEESYAPMKQRIKTILIGMGNIPMCSGIIRKLDYGFCVYPVDMFVCSLPYADNLHVCHYAVSAFDELECMHVPEVVLKALSDRRVRLMEGEVNKKLNKVKRQYNRERERSLKRSAYIKKLEIIVDKLEIQNKYLKNSVSWQVTKPLRFLRKILP